MSAGANFASGVNQTCMTHTRATAIIGTGVAIYPFNQQAGADTIAVAIGTMMQEDATVDAAARHVADMNCRSPNPLDPFRDGCGRGQAPAAPAYK